MLQLTINGLWTQFVGPLRTLTDFNTGGSLKGRKGPVTSVGRLPSLFYDSVRKADYVVYSYATPIAWHIPSADAATVPGYRLAINEYTGEWAFPPVKYSVTTTKQQNRVFTALATMADG